LTAVDAVVEVEHLVLEINVAGIVKAVTTVTTSLVKDVVTLTSEVVGDVVGDILPVIHAVIPIILKLNVESLIALLGIKIY
jgi:hypothetical protein